MSEPIEPQPKTTAEIFSEMTKILVPPEKREIRRRAAELIRSMGADEKYWKAILKMPLNPRKDYSAERV